jgi:hypothetical protein
MISLDTIVRKQPSPSEWPKIGGYLLYITDRESAGYWRPYIGQSNDLGRRVGEHAKIFLSKDKRALLYYIASRASTRQMNFIHLWTVEGYEGKEKRKEQDLVNNILEMLMCLWFQSLPLPRLHIFLGEVEQFATIGLNVVIPLLQGIRLTPKERTFYRDELRFSADPEIREFMDFRDTTLARRPIDQRRQETRQETARQQQKDYNEVLRELITSIPQSENLDLSFTGDSPILKGTESTLDTEALLRDAASTIGELTGEPVSLVLPFRSLKARIGVVLDYDIMKRGGSSNITALPYSLEGMGCDHENSLIWPFNFQQYCLPSSGRIRHPTVERDALVTITRKIVQASDLRVIIMCGENAANCLQLPSFQQTVLKIENHCYNVFLEIDGSDIKRIYLELSVPLSSLHSVDLNAVWEVSLLFKFASFIAHKTEIWPTRFINQLALQYVVLRVAQERNGSVQMTPKTMPPSVRVWLSNRGFTTDEDFKRLEEMGGTFTVGVHLAFNTSPRNRERKHHHRAQRTITMPGAELRQSFTPQQLQDMREFHQQKISQEQNASDRLPTEMNAGGSSVHDIKDDGSGTPGQDDRTLDDEMLAELAAQVAEQIDRDMAQNVSEISETVKERTGMRFFQDRKRQQLLSDDGYGFKGHRRVASKETGHTNTQIRLHDELRLSIYRQDLQHNHGHVIAMSW